LSANPVEAALCIVEAPCDVELTEKLDEQMAKGAELDQLIRQKLGGLGYEF
jgi:hypothetical protein